MYIFLKNGAFSSCTDMVFGIICPFLSCVSLEFPANHVNSCWLFMKGLQLFTVKFCPNSAILVLIITQFPVGFVRSGLIWMIPLRSDNLHIQNLSGERTSLKQDQYLSKYSVRSWLSSLTSGWWHHFLWDPLMQSNRLKELSALILLIFIFCNLTILCSQQKEVPWPVFGYALADQIWGLEADEEEGGLLGSHLGPTSRL